MGWMGLGKGHPSDPLTDIAQRIVKAFNISQFLFHEGLQ
jgi:hypothetical protein